MSLKVIFFDLGDTLIKDKQFLPGAKGALTQLRQKGVRLGIISNTADLTRADFLKLLPIDFDLNLFESKLVILSSEAHVEKPDPAIFKLALKQAATMPDACLFCTEELLHTLVAQTLGMMTARLKPPPQSDIGTFIENLVKAGLLPV